MLVDLRILELMASRMCHDVISPVGAINNGVELITEVGGSVVNEAMKLIGDSAAQAGRRLRMFRLVYGRAGSEASLTVRDARAVAEDYFAASKIKLDWPVLNVPDDAFVQRRGGLKVLLNIILLGEECLAYGGTIQVVSDPARGCRVDVAGRGAALAEASSAALMGSVSVEDITARTIHAYVTGRFAAQFGILTTPESGVDRIVFTLAS